MSALPHAVIDVFATEPFEGSPIAVVLEADETIDDQAILQAALAAGPVHSFGRKIPDLTELFQDVVTSNQNEEA